MGHPDRRIHDQIFGLEKELPRGHIWVFKNRNKRILWFFKRVIHVYMAVHNRVIANIPVMKGLLTACKRSQCLCQCDFGNQSMDFSPWTSQEFD